MNSRVNFVVSIIIITGLIMVSAARQLCWPPAILFYRCSLDLLFSPPDLRGRLADLYQTLPRLMVTQIYIFIDAYGIGKRHLEQHKNDAIIA